MRHSRPESRISRGAPGLPEPQEKCFRRHRRLERPSGYTGPHKAPRPRRSDRRVSSGPSGKPSDIDSVVDPGELDLNRFRITSDHLKWCSTLEDVVWPVKPMIRLLRRPKSLKGMRSRSGGVGVCCAGVCLRDHWPTRGLALHPLSIVPTSQGGVGRPVRRRFGKQARYGASRCLGPVMRFSRRWG